MAIDMSTCKSGLLLSWIQKHNATWSCFLPFTMFDGATDHARNFTKKLRGYQVDINPPEFISLVLGGPPDWETSWSQEISLIREDPEFTDLAAGANTSTRSTTTETTMMIDSQEHVHS